MDAESIAWFPVNKASVLADEEEVDFEQQTKVRGVVLLSLPRASRAHLSFLFLPSRVFPCHFTARFFNETLLTSKL